MYKFLSTIKFGIAEKLLKVTIKKIINNLLFSVIISAYHNTESYLFNRLYVDGVDR